MQQALLGQRVKDYRDLKDLTPQQARRLCCELRNKITDVTLKNGGHLASSLGAVELCYALLKVFDPLHDRIIFDVGHQSYAYKILTGRLDTFETIRKKGGISGYPRRRESAFDAFDTGHSSTSISAALGMSKAQDLLTPSNKNKKNIVAVIGDGALLNGMAFEALNCVRSADTKITIVLNDNEMSINSRVGGMAEHLAQISVNPTYHRLKKFVKEQCRNLSNGKGMEDRLSRWKMKLKSLLLPPNVFEAMNITYWGPFDGHNAAELEEIFSLAKRYPESLLIHVITKKGKGCEAAEKKPSIYHGVSPGSSLCEEDEQKSQSEQHEQNKSLDWSGAVAARITEAAQLDERIVCCTAAMMEGVKLKSFKQLYPTRFFDVGIAEEHMLTFAAGMAAEGLLPVVFIYSTFLQRAMDQLVHDICMQGHPVLICADRAGLVGEDGDTHQGLLDISWGRAIPNLTIMAPRDKAELNYFISQWLAAPKPALIRYPKGKISDNLSNKDIVPFAKAQMLVHTENNICLVGVGSTVELMLQAAKYCEENGMDMPSVADVRFIKPLDEEFFENIATTHSKIIIAEEGYKAGGIGEAIAAHLASKQLGCKVISLGIRDKYIAHASREEQLMEEGLSLEGIIKNIKNIAQEDKENGKL